MHYAQKVSSVFVCLLNLLVFYLLKIQYNFIHLLPPLLRESSRQIHPLRVECDIVDTCYMRLSLLQMTFGKHIDRKHICFFAGAVSEMIHSNICYVINDNWYMFGIGARRSIQHSAPNQIRAHNSPAHDDRGAVRPVHDGHGVFQGASGTTATDSGQF